MRIAGTGYFGQSCIGQATGMIEAVPVLVVLLATGRDTVVVGELVAVDDDVPGAWSVFCMQMSLFAHVYPKGQHFEPPHDGNVPDRSVVIITVLFLVVMFCSWMLQSIGLMAAQLVPFGQHTTVVLLATRLHVEVSEQQKFPGRSLLQ